MIPGVSEFVIQGITLSGEVFQPSGWAVGLCNMLATTGPDGRMIFSSYARPMIIEGLPSVVVRASLQRVDPAAYEVLRQFVTDNHLKIRPGRAGHAGEATGPYPVLGMERRKPPAGGW